MTTIDDNTTSAPGRSLEQRVAELEAANAQLLERLEAATAPATSEPEPSDPSGSRRNLFKLAAGAAAGGTALALTKAAGPVAAIDTEPINAGEVNTSGTAGRNTTVVHYTNPEAPQVDGVLMGQKVNANIFMARDSPSGTILFNANSSSYPAGVGGYAYSEVANGVYGYSSNNGFGVVGWGAGGTGVGVLARGTRANLELYNDGDAPASRTDAHVVGELVTDTNGDLWYCSVAGTPGTWQQLAGPNLPTTAFTPVDPFRAYDSREETDGRFSGGEFRTISVADAHTVDDYSNVTADALPVGAKAIAANIVAIGTTDTGFLSINPGGTTTITAATVNWGAGMNIGNAGIFRLNSSREVEAVFGPGNGAHMTVDITGFWT